MRNYSDISQEQKEKIKSYIKIVSSDHNSRIISEMVKEKFEVIIGERSVRTLLQKIRTSLDDIGETLEMAIEEVNEQEEKQYEIIENAGKLCYKLDAGKSVFVIPVEDIDRMFKDYSSKGNNLSGEKMRQKYGLKPQAWQAIKSKLSLVKDSHVISPYTLENLSEEQADQLIEKSIGDHIDTKIGKFVNSYEKQFKERANKALKTVANFQYQLNMVQEAILLHEPIAADFVPEKIEGDEEAHYVISDIHFGKTDTAGVIRRMNEIYQDIVSNPARVIHVTCLGDLVETIAQGGMHPTQLDEGYDATFGMGFDAVMHTVTIMEKWITGLAKEGKKVYFKGLTGNHDRFTQNKEFDHRRTGGLVMYELLKRGLSQLDVDVQYFKEFIVTFVADGIEYVAIHGDGTIGRQSPEKLIIAHAKTNFYKVLLSGDKHCLQMSEGKDFTAIKCPATAGKGAYDTDMNLHSCPGYLQIKRNRYDTADVFIKRLK